MKQAALRPESYTKKVALVLQGGGALGSYQAGVYEALASSDYKPDWVAGISIGAINAALIAGNSPEMRVEKLREFWRTITTSAIWPVRISDLVNGAGLPFDLGKQISAMHALMFGQSNFFAPRKPTDWWFGHTPTSYYDTSSLKSTLERLVDFDRINSREIRFSVGAVNVRTGNFAYFDNAETEIRPEHVLASGALPPGFPSVEIDGEHYWDGGLVSNTPLQYVIEYYPRRSHLIFQVDLFPGPRRRAREFERGYRAGQGHPLFQPNAGGYGHIAAASRSAPQHQHALGETSRRSEDRPGSRLAQRIPLRDYHGHRSSDLPSGARAGTIKGLRIRSPDDGNAMGAGSLRCAGNDNGCAVAGADAAGARSAHIRRSREGSDRGYLEEFVE